MPNTVSARLLLRSQSRSQVQIQGSTYVHRHGYILDQPPMFLGSLPTRATNPSFDTSQVALVSLIQVCDEVKEVALLLIRL